MLSVLFRCSLHFYCIQRCQIIFNTIMAYHRIKLTDQLQNSLSFSHQQSISHQDSKHKKKGSLYVRNSGTPNYTRIRTDERQPSYFIRQEQGTSMTIPNQQGHSNHSATKMSRRKKSTTEGKKPRKKHTISVINLGKSQDSKLKGSSTVTKRKHSTVDFGDKIKEKIEDFKIIANCLDEYTRQERRNSGEVNLAQILKIISAFNRSQIAPISKPLEKLIRQIVLSIQSSLPEQAPTRKHTASFDSPQKASQDQPEQIKATVKKNQGSREYLLRKEDLGADAGKLEENLDRLKYESNRLKYFLDELTSSGAHKKSSHTAERQKVEELQKLRGIAREQSRIIHQLEQGQEEHTFRDEGH